MPIELTCPQCGRKYKEPADRCDVDGSPLYGPEVHARLGMHLNNYKVLKIIGEGGMGVVYRGEHVMLKKPVAIKILHNRFARREGAVDQFLKEAQAASSIRHPNIVDVTDFGTAPDGSVYFIMEYLEGESLEEVLARDARIPLFNAVNVVRQIGSALASAHDRGIVHLDLKPDNVYLTQQLGRRRIVRAVHEDGKQQFVVEPEGNFDFVKLLDFGVARFMHDGGSPLSANGMVFGTPHYMSPEQAKGEHVDGRSDIYSLGILFYEMILGDVPFDGETPSEILSGHVSGKVVQPKDRNPAIRVDDGTNATIMKCLEKHPSKRFQTLDEFVLALDNCFDDRVFLRDAHKLPGAYEAGIVPPTPSTRPRPPANERLTDELKQLFGADSRAVEAAVQAKRERPTPEIDDAGAPPPVKIFETDEDHSVRIVSIPKRPAVDKPLAPSSHVKVTPPPGGFPLIRRKNSASHPSSRPTPVPPEEKTDSSPALETKPGGRKITAPIASRFNKNSNSS